MLGKLDWSAIPFDQPIPLVAALGVFLAAAAVLGWITVKGYWPYLWNEWISSVDHKRIGVMYIVLAMLMLLRGFIDAIMMRTQQVLAIHGPGYLPPEHYDQIFSAHGTIMIFFAAMPFMIGLMNFVVPLQLGIRDVAFPTLNSVSFWLTASGALLVNISLVIGEFARTGWLPYAPLSETTYSPGVGVDYYLWSIQISGVGTLLTGVNLVTTILKMRAPGMGYLRMPMFCWTALAANLLIVAAFPILTATLAMLTLDRYLGFHFFTNEAGGNQMMFVNLIWAWGHPEVYILVLPAFGIFSEIFSTFSSKPLFGYRSMVAATMFICIVSFMVWLHHFFTMGAGADVNAAFGIATSVIAVGTGVKIYNWLFTMYGGRVRFNTPMLWALAFVTTFTIGGMTGVLLAVPPADFVLHNSLFLVAHFHNVIISGVLFGAFAGFTYWFPKAFGFRLHEGWGKAAFWVTLAGYILVFVPLYIAGLLGMTRRLQHIDMDLWTPWLTMAALGVLVMIAGAALQITQLLVSIRHRDQLRDETGDPWDGRSLEWSTSSPPPAFNYARLPHVEDEEPYWRIKQRGREEKRPDTEGYDPIEMPRNTPTGFVTAFFGTLIGFALIWHIWWLAIVGFIGAYITFVVFAWRDHGDYEIPADEVARIDRNGRAAQLAFLRSWERPV
ncbi:cytochrome o ubiquinol oxidase subunit I [Mesorhizobium sp. B2-1-3A]|uniref:cytochrome o ubiquinol oxidase subunit I n=1 Tax=Mesorhizobium sp. B2-1-3A TaxID=2589971 RepID=UPI0015E28FDA|nr:cytochrome o ubiquinol oxidase subunit I [Mesorhizobium sp. B2-1-3A]